MSQLTPFVRAFDHFAEALKAESDLATKCGDEKAAEGKRDSAIIEFQNATLLLRLARASKDTAIRLQQQIADDLARGPGRQSDRVFHIPSKDEISEERFINRQPTEVVERGEGMSEE